MELWKQQITSYFGQSKYQHLATLFSKYIVYQSFEGSALEDINAIPPHHFPQLLAAQTYTFKWWMGHYKGCTPKRHWAYCNSRAIHRLDKGVLQGWKKGSSKKVVTAEHYIDGKGKKRYKGTSKLKGTETLDKL